MGASWSMRCRDPLAMTQTTVANISVYVFSRQADELGGQSIAMRFLEKPIGAHDVETHGAREGLPERAAEMVSRPCLASRRRRRHLPAILVSTSENKVCGHSLDRRNGRGYVGCCLACLFLFAHVRLLWMRSWRRVQKPICPAAFRL
ncbi:putative transmembrane protein [Rhizobium johnstonii 3841]|uniref:Transmembrane protein n=1 Tax=Rhizobium johnstonii (strain DSM 114642 / LMG 32736 / 3841) TaxID=216596 RepID=Q1MI41_RHIJ3|nr:putative transmembrane protein [Rhizobium johnstonii 3841]